MGLFGKSKSPFNITKIESGYELSRSEIISLRETQGFEIENGYSLKAKMKCSDVSEFVLENEFDTNGRVSKCELYVWYKSDLDKITSIAERYGRKAKYTIVENGQSYVWDGWKLSNGEIMSDWLGMSGGYKSKIFPVSKIEK